MLLNVLQEEQSIVAPNTIVISSLELNAAVSSAFVVTQVYPAAWASACDIRLILLIKLSRLIISADITSPQSVSLLIGTGAIYVIAA